MGVGFQTSSGQIIKGKFGEALAKANPNQGVSYADQTREQQIQSVFRPSRGGGSATVQADQARSARNQRIAEQAQQAQLQQLADEQARQQALAQQRQHQQIVGARITEMGQRTVEVPPVQLTPFLEKRQIDTIRDPTTGRKIPVTKVVHVDPSGTGVQKERPATEQERQTFESQTKEVESSTDKAGILRTSGIYASYNDVVGGIQQIDYQAGQGIRNLTGFTEEEGQQQLQSIQESTDFLKSKAGKIDNIYLQKIAVFGAEAGGQVSSAFGYVGEETISSPILSTGKRVVLGTALGFGFGALSTGASAIGGTAGTFTTAGLNVVGYGAGGYYAVGQISKYAGSKTTVERGSVLGETALDVSLVGAGTLIGGRIFTQGLDFYRTRGRVELPVEELGLVTATEVLSGKKRFVESSQFGYTGKTGLQKQKFDIKIFERAGRSYSATPKGGFLGKTFTAGKGSSEFAGIYTAPTPSFYFLKAGEQPVKLFGLYKGIGSPKLATIYGKGFTTKGLNTKGVGYVTGVKPEIEAVFGEGTIFARTGQDVFFKFGGRSIPADTFIYKGGTGTVKTPTFTVKDISASYSSYSGSYSLISPATIPISSSGKSSSYGGLRKVSIQSFSSSSSGKPSYVSSSIYRRPSRSRGGSSRSSISSISPSISSLSKSSGKSSSRASPSIRFLYSSSSSRAKTSPYTPTFTSSGIPKVNFRSKKIRTPKRFTVSVRRFGKFRPIGTFGSLRRAFSRGKSKVSETLGATFKIKGAKKLKTPKGFRKKISKEGTLFIEKRRFRLSKRGEKVEIVKAKRTKSRGKK